VKAISFKFFPKLVFINAITREAEIAGRNIHRRYPRILIYHVIIPFSHPDDKTSPLQKALIRAARAFMYFLAVNMEKLFFHHVIEFGQLPFIQIKELLADMFFNLDGNDVPEISDQEGIIGCKRSLS
jgi:hypothetical protein